RRRLAVNRGREGLPGRRRRRGHTLRERIAAPDVGTGDADTRFRYRRLALRTRLDGRDDAVAGERAEDRRELVDAALAFDGVLQNFAYVGHHRLRDRAVALGLRLVADELRRAEDSRAARLGRSLRGRKERALGITERVV